MGYPQWSDVGMFIQSVLLLALENNLHTCAQESWASFHDLVNKHTKAPKNLMLFCGISIGYMDTSKVIITKQKMLDKQDSFENEIGLSSFDLALISINKNTNRSKAYSDKSLNKQF